MNALLLLSSLAFGDPPEPTYQRLFAAEPLAAAPALEAMPESAPMPTSGWAWPALLSGVGLVAAWQLRKRAQSATPADLRIVQRHSLGDKSSLMVVEVQDASGATRRLLLGTAGNGINLLNDLGVVAATGSQAVSIPADDDGDYEASAPTAAPARVHEFHDLLQEVLTERQPDEVPASIGELPRPRYFSPDDLAHEHELDADPMAEVEAPVTARAPRGSRRRATLRSRVTARVDVTADPTGWTPTVESYLPHATVELPVVEPRVQPVLRGAAALLARPATPAPAKAGLSLLVKGTLPAEAPAAVPTAPPAHATPTIAPPMMLEPEPMTFLPPLAAQTPEAAIAVAPPPAAEAPAAPTRAVYVSPTMSSAPRTEKRLVGPPLRDPRLTAGAPATPRLRLADPRTRAAAAAEEVVPPVGELIARLKEAQDAENAAPAMAANDQPRAARTDGIRRRFETLSVKEGGR